jgi:predicted DNA-binding transcriptional regulator YafY
VPQVEVSFRPLFGENERVSGPSSRLLALLSLLQTRRDWPGALLAERLDVTPRTVRRDIDRLRELGYRVSAVRGPDGGYRLEPGTQLPPLLFDDRQAVAIAVALQSAATSGIDIGEDAERALATVRQVMPGRLRHRIDAIRFAGTPSTGPADPAVLTAVSDAIRSHLTLRFSYGEEDRPPRRAEPHGLVARHGRWYVVAWDLDRDDWRILRLDRIDPRTPTGPRFTPRPVPTGDVRTFVAARAKGAQAEDRWPCVGTVEIDRPARAVAPWVHDGTLEETGSHTCRLTLGSWSWTGLVAYVARFDASFRVVEPPALAVAAASLATRLADAAGP